MKGAEAEIRKQRMISLNHYIIGLGLLIKGIEKSEHFSQHPLSVIFFFAAAGVIIAGTYFHHSIAKVFRKFDAAFFILEGIALFLAGLILLEKAGSKIPYILFLLALVYMMLGGATLYAEEHNREEIFSRLGIVIGYMFIAAGIIMALVNVIWFNSFWMYLTALIILAMGIILIKFKVLVKKFNK